MNALTRFLFSVLVVCCTLSLSAEEIPFAKPEDVGLSAAKLREIEPAVGRILDDGKVAGAVTLVLRKGKVAHLEAHGFRDLEKRIPMTEDTIFRIYSMTKPIVSVGVMMLVDEGKVQLDQPVTDFFPEFKKLKVYGENGNVAPKRMPTVRDLLLHTAGFTYPDSGDTPVHKLYREAELQAASVDSVSYIEKLSELPLLFHPGEQWEYSMSIDVLGVLIERVSGSSLDHFLQKRILEPLDMLDTGFHVPSEKRDRVGPVYGPSNSGEMEISDWTGVAFRKYPPRFFSGGGGLLSTARDYSRFLQMLLNGGELDGVRLLKTDTVALMTLNHLPEMAYPIGGDNPRAGVGFGYGFAVAVEPSWDADSRIGECTWGGAAATRFWFSPDEELGVITMEQTRPGDREIRRAIKGLIYEAILD